MLRVSILLKNQAQVLRKIVNGTELNWSWCRPCLLDWILTHPGVTDKAAAYLIYNGRETGAVPQRSMRAASMNRDLKKGRDCLRLKNARFGGTEASCAVEAVQHGRRVYAAV